MWDTPIYSLPLPAGSLGPVASHLDTGTLNQPPPGAAQLTALPHFEGPWGMRPPVSLLQVAARKWWPEHRAPPVLEPRPAFCPQPGTVKASTCPCVPSPQVGALE